MIGILGPAHRPRARGRALLPCATLLASLVAPAAPAVTLIEYLQFEGDRFGPERNSFPPDTMGAIGGPSGNTFVELLNTGYTQYDTGAQPPNQHGSGVLVGPRLTLKEFWDTAFENTAGGFGLPTPGLVSDDPFDPRIVYDPNTARWYATSVDHRRSSQSRVYIGVTTSSDPSPSQWRGFALDADSDNLHWADFPTLGYNTEGVFIATEMFAIDPTNPNVEKQSHLYGVAFDTLLAPVPTIDSRRIVEDIGLNTAVQPAVDFHAQTANPNTTYFGFGNSFEGGGQYDLKRFAIPSDFFTGGNPGPLEDVFITTTGPGDAAYQAGQGLTPIDNGSGGELSSNVVLTPFGYFGVVNVEGTGNGNSAIRWFQADAETGDQLATGLIEDPTMDYLYPSIAVNDFGKILVGFNWMWNAEEVGPDVFSGFSAPGIAAVGGVVDPNGVITFGTPDVSIGASTSETYERSDNFGRNRWGDYSATTAMPKGPFFWTTQEFAPEKDTWATSLSQILVLGPNEVFIDDQGPPGDGFFGVDAQLFEDGYTLEKVKIDADFTAVPDDLFDVGDMGILTHDALFSAILVQDGGDILELDQLQAQITQKFTLTRIDDDLTLFDTELLGFDLNGLPDGIVLGLDDLIRSLGTVSLLDTPQGMLMDAYIDLHASLQIGGQTFASQDASRLLLFAQQTVPAPPTAMLVLLALGVFGVRRGRSSAAPG